MFVILHPEIRKGRLAEGLGTGLQNLLLRFKSGSDLKEKETRQGASLFFLPTQRAAGLPPEAGGDVVQTATGHTIEALVGAAAAQGPQMGQVRTKLDVIEIGQRHRR